MGLDMHLTGEKFTMPDWEHPENDEMVDGFRLKNRELDLGYWRKHPDLHGFIVQTFAGGVDNCQRVQLTVSNIEEIISAIRDDNLPPTEGFFFGKSENDDEQKKETIEFLTKAIEWAKVDISQEFRLIYYQASW